MWHATGSVPIRRVCPYEIFRAVISHCTARAQYVTHAFYRRSIKIRIRCGKSCKPKRSPPGTGENMSGRGSCPKPSATDQSPLSAIANPPEQEIPSQCPPRQSRPRDLAPRREPRVSGKWHDKARMWHATGSVPIRRVCPYKISRAVISQCTTHAQYVTHAFYRM